MDHPLNHGNCPDRRTVGLCPAGLAVAWLAYVYLLIAAVLVLVTHDRRWYLLAVCGYLMLVLVLSIKVWKVRRRGRHLPHESWEEEYIVGETKNDTITAAGGNDILPACAVKGSIVAGSEDDHASGGRGNDTLDREAGYDHLDGGIYDDSIRGGSSNDVLFAGDGNDTLDGQSGADVYHTSGDASSFVDTLFVEPGTDTFTDRDGNDIVL